jgi:N-terminal domain of anti-restriction factor ArdC
MSSSAARSRTGRNRPSLYQEITDKIIAELEAGRVPWVQPWGTVAAKASLTMPKNAATQRQYSGINVLILWDAAIEHGFGTQNWLTFRQALRLGGNVREGEHGTTVVYADRFVPDEERERAERNGDEPNAIPFLKRFPVFNADQCEHLPAELTSAPAPVPDGLILPNAEALIAATGADFRIGGDRALYRWRYRKSQRRAGRPRRVGGREKGFRLPVAENIDMATAKITLRASRDIPFNKLVLSQSNVLFAHCAALSINAVHEPLNRNPQRLAHADALARAVNLETVVFISVASRRRACEASAQLIDHLKKPEMAKRAERLLTDLGWLPEPLHDGCPDRQRQCRVGSLDGHSARVPR